MKFHRRQSRVLFPIRSTDIAQAVVGHNPIETSTSDAKRVSVCQKYPGRNIQCRRRTGLVFPRSGYFGQVSVRQPGCHLILTQFSQEPFKRGRVAAPPGCQIRLMLHFWARCVRYFFHFWRACIRIVRAFPIIIGALLRTLPVCPTVRMSPSLPDVFWPDASKAPTGLHRCRP